MPYTASALGRSSDGSWRGADLELSEVEDVDGLIELVQTELDTDGEHADAVVFFLEEDDEYLLIGRVNGAEDAQLFVSDRRVLAGSGLAGRIVGDELAIPEPEEDDEESSRPEVEPAGDTELLTSLGVSAPELLALCAKEGQLPSDVVFAICERIGAADVLEAVRGV